MKFLTASPQTQALVAEDRHVQVVRPLVRPERLLAPPSSPDLCPCPQ